PGDLAPQTVVLFSKCHPVGRLDGPSGDESGRSGGQGGAGFERGRHLVSPSPGRADDCSSPRYALISSGWLWLCAWCPVDIGCLKSIASTATVMFMLSLLLHQPST